MKTLNVNRKIIGSIILVLTSFCFMAETTYSEVSISEIMYGSESSFTPPQWIEIFNTGTEPVNLTGWKITIQNADAINLDGPVNATIVFEDEFWGDAPVIWPNDFLLIVVDTDDNSGGFLDDQIFSLTWRGGLGIGFWDTFLSGNGFLMQLIDNNGNLVDKVGNYDGTTKLWDLPYNFNRGKTRAGNRTSLIRRYANGVALDGTLKESWVSAVDANLTRDQRTYYGDENDISSPGILNKVNSSPPVVVEQPSTVPVANTGTTPPVVTQQPGTPQPGTPPVVTQQPPTSTTTVRLLPATVTAPAVGDELTFSLDIVDGVSVAGYEATVQFNKTAFRHVASEIGDYLSAGAFFAPPVVEEGSVKLTATSLKGEVNGNGTLATITFEVIAEETFTLTLSDVLLADRKGKSSVPQVESAQIGKTAANGLKGDVNGDGTVNVQDLVLVGASLGQTGQNAADINEDGVVNISDLVLVAGALGTSAAAPSLHPQSLEMLTATDVKQWLSAAQHLDLTDTTSQRGLLFLQQLLITLTPKEPALLANYPNPFNPETWIPYHLAKDADVKLHIYAVNGTLVRTLTLGHQSAGLYQNRSRAAYWDGKNAFGESVASGVYFYTLTAGDFTDTRRMLIRK